MRALILATRAFAVTAQGAAAAAEPAGARKVIERIIAQELQGDHSMRSEAYLSHLTRRFRAALVKDMSGPEINVTDSDILCQCQDVPDEMHILSITGTGDTATARVKSRVGFISPPETVTWRMRREGKTWRISDIATDHSASLLAELEASNRKLGK